jgi:tetratricopeptide (TPR) repeat protein
LDAAARYNRWNDIYYRNLSHALLLLAAKEVNTAQDGQQLPQNRVQYIQALTGASINAAARATGLAPHNVLNWLSRANIYREFVPVIGADAEKFAVEAGERAIALEPVNPDNHVDLGRTYLLIADSAQQMTASKDEEVKKGAEAKVSEMLKKAEGAFLKAIDLKADYAPAHYQLGITYDRQGQLDKAISTMETVAKQNQLDVGVAFQLGLLYMRRAGEGDDERAQNALEHAVELAPSYANARWFLAAVYEKQGALDKAIEQVSKVLETNPDNELVKSRLERLQTGAAAEATEPIEEGEGGVVQVPDGQPQPPAPADASAPVPAPAPTF